MQAAARQNRRLHFTDEQIEQANNVSLLDLARQYGYELEDRERKAYHAKHSGGLYFYKDRNVFKHFARDTKGGAIQFVMMEENLSFVDAVKRLLGPSCDPIRQKTPRQYTPPFEKKALVLPEKASDYKRAYWYLTGFRGIAPTIVSAMINEKRVYQDKRGNCVFIGYDEENQPKYCAKRGTSPDYPYKQDMTGSDKSYPFHITGRSEKLYVLESPIDAMSHAALAMLHGIDWRLDHRISLGCLSDKALERFLRQHEIAEIIFAFDNDFDGRKLVQATREEYYAAERSGDVSAFTVTENSRINKLVPCNWGQEAALSLARKYKKIGYRVGVHTPEGKDFSVDLMACKEAAVVNDIEMNHEDYESEV